MDKDLTSVEIIGLAIRSEEEASQFYAKIARMVKNDLVRLKYEELSKEELGHKAILSRLYFKMTGERPKDIPGRPVTAEGGMPVSVKNLEDILLLAIAREQEANSFYSKAARRMQDLSAQRVLEYLSDMEKGHELMLKRELSAYRRDKDWYADNPELQLVG